jgi:hypothetical protein
MQNPNIITSTVVWQWHIKVCCFEAKRQHGAKEQLVQNSEITQGISISVAPFQPARTTLYVQCFWKIDNFIHFRVKSQLVQTAKKYVPIYKNIHFFFSDLY